MIIKCKKKDISQILYIINESSIKYKGVIPKDSWHEPYMTKLELENEISNGVCMYGFKKNNKLVGVMGIQELKQVTLIRHAYILSAYQRLGIGKSLLQYLFKINLNSNLLVGTWQKAIWAIEFYKKFGFTLHNRKQTIYLLNKYWTISSNQIENSVVLEKIN